MRPPKVFLWVFYFTSMNELIKVTEQNGNQLISARELYAFLEASERFSNWIERQFQYGFVENVDYVGCKVFNTLAKQELDDFSLTIDTAKHISMMQKSEKGMQARQYFIEIEKNHKALAPSTYLEALKALVISEEAKQLAEIKVKELEPKAEVFDAICLSNDNLSLNEAAKIIGIGRNTMMKDLRQKGILQSNNNAYQKYIDLGYFVVKLTYNAFIQANISTTLVTGKGLTWLKTKYS